MNYVFFLDFENLKYFVILKYFIKYVLMKNVYLFDREKNVSKLEIKVGLV